MAVITNKNSTQSPLTAAGVTGVQSIRHIPCSRVYLKDVADSVTSAPVNQMAAYTRKSNGATPTSPDANNWMDAGIMLDSGKITYTKTKKKVQTGLDKVTRAVYIEEKSAEMEFNLAQVDDYLMSKLGFVASTITAGSTVNFQLGQEDIVSRALLLVYQNKLDGKEIQWYHPAAQLAVSFEDVDGGLALKVTADCIAFVAEGQGASPKDSLLSATIFA